MTTRELLIRHYKRVWIVGFASVPVIVASIVFQGFVGYTLAFVYFGVFVGVANFCRVQCVHCQHRLDKLIPNPGAPFGEGYRELRYCPSCGRSLDEPLHPIPAVGEDSDPES